MAHCVLLPAYYLVKTSLRISLSSLGTCCARLCSAARLVSPAADRGADLDADLASAEAEAEAEATVAAAAAAAAAESDDDEPMGRRQRRKVGQIRWIYDEFIAKCSGRAPSSRFDYSMQKN